MLEQPLPNGFDPFEERAFATVEVSHDGAQAFEERSAIEEIRGGCQISFTSQPIGLVAKILAHAQRVMDYAYARPRPFPSRRSNVHTLFSIGNLNANDWHGETFSPIFLFTANCAVLR